IKYTAAFKPRACRSDNSVWGGVESGDRSTA
ncbi:hypothetical protein A2U01_0092675, partial [Trifolium medium]|nr:hypothetical protein [Trifolium medium]